MGRSWWKPCCNLMQQNTGTCSPHTALCDTAQVLAARYTIAIASTPHDALCTGHGQWKPHCSPVHSIIGASLCTGALIFRASMQPCVLEHTCWPPK